MDKHCSVCNKPGHYNKTCPDRDDVKARNLRFAAGNWVQLAGDMGDYHNGKSVVTPKGTRGKILRWEERPPYGMYIVVEMHQTNGQPILTTAEKDIEGIWEPWIPPAPPADNPGNQLSWSW